MGNTRLTFTDKNNNAKIDVDNTTNSEILQENHYYAFGMTHEGPWLMTESSKDNAYQYNGKEYNNDYGLNWSDYGARMYDACIGRWTSVDPVAEMYFMWSSYHFSGNAPINQIDKNGMYYDWYNNIQQFLYRHIPNARLDVIHSDLDHDGFLTESRKVTQVIRNVMEGVK